MKIQNAEMNFVMFDTEDVIVTSGPVVGQAMAAQLKTLVAYNEQYSSLKFNNKDNNTKYMDSQIKANYWLTYDVDDSLRRAQGLADEKKPEGDYFYANTVAQIKQWLDFNTKQ